LLHCKVWVIVTYFCPNISATLPLKHLLMITQQEKDVKAADKEDAGKEDVEETKKGSIKIPSNCHSLFQIYWKRIELLDARKKPTQDIVKLSAPLKNKIQHHAIKTMNIKSFLTWKLLYLFVVVVNLCHAILDDFWILWTQSTCLKSSNPDSKKSTNPILRAIIPLFPSTTMTPTCDCLS